MFTTISLLTVPPILAFLHQKRDELLKQKGKNEKLFYFLLILFLALFAGLRTKYNDTGTYIHIYETHNDLSGFFRDIPSVSNYLAFNFVLSVMKSLKMDYHMFLVLFSAFYNSVFIWFVHKYSKKLFPVTVFLFIVCDYAFTWAAIKQCAAMGFGFFAIDSLIDKKWCKYFVFMLLAYLFHPSIIILFVLPFFVNAKPWSKRFYLFVCFMAILGVFMNFTSHFIEGFMGYSSDYMLDHTVDPLRFVVTLVPLLLTFIYKDFLYKDVESDCAVNIIFCMCICTVMFMFWALFGNPILFARICSIFSLGSLLSLIYIFEKFYENERTRDFSKLICVVACLCYLIVFLVQHSEFGIAHELGQISVFDFSKCVINWLKNLFL